MIKSVAKYFQYFICILFLSSCSSVKINNTTSEEDVVSVNVRSEIINAGYIGNGVEWDPYDEAESWGVPVSDKDWEKLFKRVDFMKMPYVRVMINSPYRYFHKSTGKYDKTRNIASIFKLLRYCTEKNITVIFGEYNPPAFEMKDDAPGWVAQSAQEMDHLIGVYDVHAYPGQAQLRSGKFPAELAKYKKHVPAGKKIVLGEAGYKYWRAANSKLMEEYNKRAKAHPYTKGSDANMFVYDFFYGLDMPLLCMEVMNNGFSGVAAWMLDDAMHSNGDSGKPKDIKLWGMWNILGEEVFGMPAEENIRPWYYTWALMCRYFPRDGNLLKCDVPENKNIRFSVAEINGKMTVAVVNFGNTDEKIKLQIPRWMKNSKMYIYEENNRPVDKDGLPVPVKTAINIKKDFSFELKAQSFVLITNLD